MRSTTTLLIAIACSAGGFAVGFYTHQSQVPEQAQIDQPSPSKEMAIVSPGSMENKPQERALHIADAVGRTDIASDAVTVTLDECQGMIHQALSSVTEKSGMKLMPKDYEPELQVISENYSENTISAAWAKQHIQRSSEVIDQIASDAYKTRMKQMIAEESEFSQPREKKRSDHDDQNWATQKEIELRNIIESQTYDGFVTIDQLICKQLMCEIIATASDTDTWFKAEKAIHFNAADLIRPWEREEQLTSSIFRDEDVKYTYKVFEFTQ